MTNSEFSRVLAERTEAQGLLPAIRALIGNGAKVEIGFSAEACAAGIDEMNLSVRSMNALRRAGIATVGEVIAAISGDELPKVRNLGKKSLNEIKMKILDYGFAQLSPFEKRAFLEDLASRNTPAEVCG